MSENPFFVMFHGVCKTFQFSSKCNSVSSDEKREPSTEYAIRIPKFEEEETGRDKEKMFVTNKESYKQKLI